MTFLCSLAILSIFIVTLISGLLKATQLLNPMSSLRIAHVEILLLSLLNTALTSAVGFPCEHLISPKI